MVYAFLAANQQMTPVYFLISFIIAVLTAFISIHLQRHGRMNIVQSIALTLLTTYIFLVFSSTVFSRTSMDHYCYELIPFWSYREILQGRYDAQYLFWENILNVFMLLPMGVLLPVVIRPVLKDKKKDRVFIRVVMMGFLTSLTIEILQLVSKRGMFEFDDMFHNTLGVVIGYCIWKIMRRFCRT
jgi:glycopeptide antibiotics resistance protein